MIVKSKKHLAYYLSLLGILLLGFCLYFFSGDNEAVKKIAILMTAFFYVLWGVVHHIIHHDTTAKVVIEYVLIGILGIAMALLTMQ